MGILFPKEITGLLLFSAIFKKETKQRTDYSSEIAHDQCYHSCL